MFGKAVTHISAFGPTILGATSVVCLYAVVRSRQLDRKLDYQEKLFREGLSDEDINYYSNQLSGPHIDVVNNGVVQALKTIKDVQALEADKTNNK